MIITDKINLLNQITDKFTSFLLADMQTGKDFREFSKIEDRYLSEEEKRTRTLTYLYTRKISNKSLFDYYLNKTLNLTPKEVLIIEAMRDAFVGVFEIKKVLKTGFELYSIINEKTYNVNAIGTMTAFRGAYQGAFLYCCLCKIEDEYYIYDTRAITPADKVGGAQRYAISRIIENTDLVFYDNEEKLNEIKEQIQDFDKKFKECFDSSEVITTNKFADEVINSFNDFCETGNTEIKNIVDNGIKKPEKFCYFQTKDFNFTKDDFAQKSMAGFSAQDNEYDVGIVFIENAGLYAIPFFGTFCRIFEEEDFKNINGYKACVINFLQNEKIPSVILQYVSDKYDNFVSRINEIIGDNNDSTDTLLKKYKRHNLDKPVISPASILYSSKVFSQIMVKEVRKEEKKSEPQIEKVGRNDLCPCGSGKKYKKCCMLKQEQDQDE